jgi:adenosylhomocysteine nucleosidase
MRIAIIAALPGELKPLVRHWPRIATGAAGTKQWVLSDGADTWIAVCAGMGAEAVRRAYSIAVLDGPVDMLLSVGWAGSLHTEVKPGTVHVPTIVIDTQTGEQFNLTEGKRKFRLVTTAHVADAAEKSRLAATYKGAVLVDMEAATVARLAAMHETPLLCIKGVSDAAGARLPDLNRFIDRTGQMQLARFITHVALRPQYWPSLLHLGRNSARAAEAMRDLILEFMKEKDVNKLIRTGSV